MWFKLNEDTRISIRTSVGKSDSKLIKNSLGQGSFGAALASSLNIGSNWVNELGCKESIDATIKERIRKQTSKVNDNILLADAPMMGADWSSRAAIKLFEAQVIPALLFNCESWIGITKTQINDLQGFQDKFMRKLMHLPASTPKAILHWDSRMEMMKWRIAKRKLLFLKKVMAKEDSNSNERDNPGHRWAGTQMQGNCQNPRAARLERQVCYYK